MKDLMEWQQKHMFDLNLLRKYLDNNLKLNKNIQNNSEISEIKIEQFTQGQSNPTFLIHYNMSKIVLRKKPPGKLLKGAHQIDREYKIINALYSVGFPVPKPIFYCEDTTITGTEFYLMDYVEGRIFRDFRLSNLSPDERAEVFQEFIRIIILLQSLDIKALQLENFGKLDDKYFERQIATWSRQYKSSETQEIKEVDFLIDWLPKNIPQKCQLNNGINIVHGDLRLDNVIFHPTENKIIAVLDWELSTLGPPIVDFSYSALMYYFPSNFFSLGNFDKGFYGIPSVTEYRNIFFKNSNLKPPSESEWCFYIAFNCFKMAGIGQGVYKRSLLGNASSPIANSFLNNTIQVAQKGYLMSLNGIEYSQGLDFKIKRLKENSLFKFFSDKLSDKFYKIHIELTDFMERYIYPKEREFVKEIESKLGNERWKFYSKTIEELKEKAKEKGLWNLFLPEISKITNLEYAILCQIMGRSFFMAPEVFNCSAPDTGNMEVLFRYGSKLQQMEYLEPLLQGRIRSCFSMTEKGVASSEATNISSTVIKDVTDSNYYIVNGRKWWISGAGDPRCNFTIFMGITPDKQKPKHKQHSMILIPMNSAGVKILRPMNVFGYDDAPHGHMDILFHNVRVPKENIILGEGRGFEIAQGRLGPGRIHHCMRIFGIAERALENMLDRVSNRKIFGKLLMKNDEVIKIIAECKTELFQAQLLVLYSAFKIDQLGAKSAKNEIAMIKIAAPNVALKIIDRAIQLHGAEGVSQDTFLAYAWAGVRTLRIADGPDEVHLRSVGKSIIENFNSKF